MWNCPNCETENAEETKTCLVCGAQRPAPGWTGGINADKNCGAVRGAKQEPTGEMGWHCTCGTRNEDAACFCKNCGAARGAKQEPPREMGWRCVCGMQNGNDARFCKNCGKPKGSAAGTVTTAPKTGVQAEYKALEAKANTMRGLALACIAAMLFVLFLLPYAVADYTKQYTVYNNMAGVNGSIEQICSIVLLCFALLPIPYLLMKQTVTKRNLPITLSLVSAGAIAIYSAVIWFGSMLPTAVPFLIILSAASEVLCTVKYIEALKAMDNLMFRPQAL